MSCVNFLLFIKIVYKILLSHYLLLQLLLLHFRSLYIFNNFIFDIRQIIIKIGLPYF